MCTIDMPTGRMSVNTSAIIGYFTNCSMVFLWTSKDNSLLAPDWHLGWELPNEPRPIARFLIYVDFLPALESLRTVASEHKSVHDYFLVPKHCNACEEKYITLGHGWQKSWCMAELNDLTKRASANHIKCYQIMKHIHSFEARKYAVNNYHVKNIALHYSVSCTDTTKDIVDCVMEMMQELLSAYESASLKHFKLPSLDLLSNYRKQDLHVHREISKGVIKRLLSLS